MRDGQNILRHIVCEDGDSMLVLGTVPEPDATMLVTLTHRISTGAEASPIPLRWRQARGWISSSTSWTTTALPA